MTTNCWPIYDSLWCTVYDWGWGRFLRITFFRHVRDVVGHGSLIKVMAYILGIILPKCHCMHFYPYLVKLISVKLRSSATYILDTEPTSQMNQSAIVKIEWTLCRSADKARRSDTTRFGRVPGRHRTAPNWPAVSGSLHPPSTARQLGAATLSSSPSRRQPLSGRHISSPRQAIPMSQGD